MRSVQICLNIESRLYASRTKDNLSVVAKTPTAGQDKNLTIPSLNNPLQIA